MSQAEITDKLEDLDDMELQALEDELKAKAEIEAIAQAEAEAFQAECEAMDAAYEATYYEGGGEE